MDTSCEYADLPLDAFGSDPETAPPKCQNIGFRTDSSSVVPESIEPRGESIGGDAYAASVSEASQERGRARSRE